MTATLESLRGVLDADCVDTWRSPEGVELPRAAPRTLEGWREAMRFAASGGLRVVPMGSGSKLGWCHPAEADLVLSTRNWRGVVAYEPGDGTLSARSGSPMSGLHETVEAGGHALTPDVARPAEATLGGVLAAGQSGVDRLARGAAREACLGLEVLLADGRVAKSGGRLVKNVTGYDLHRLYCGSHGTLCVILEASLRLSPLPRAWRVLRAPCADAQDALARCRTLRDAPIRPLAVTAHDLDQDGEWTVLVVLAGREDVLDVEARCVREALSEADELRGAAARAAVEEARDLERRGGSWPELVVTTLPAQLAAALHAAREAAEAEGMRARMLVQPWLASASIWLEDPGPAGEATSGSFRAERLPRLHQRLFSPLWRVEWRNAPHDLGRRIDVFASSPSPGIALMKRLQATLDPDGVFARGRFHGQL